MKSLTMQNFSGQNPELQAAKESQTITKTPGKNGSCRKQDAKTVSLSELIRNSQNRDPEATLTLIHLFSPLLEREARLMTEQALSPEKEDAKSDVVTAFLDFIEIFHDFGADDSRVSGLIKKYLHDSRIDKLKAARRHCPDSCQIDFEKEIEENSPFAQYFPRYEMQADDRLEREFVKRAMCEAFQVLSRKEKFVLKKYFIENKPPSSVARELHCSTRYLRKIRQSALSRLRLYLEAHYPSLCER